MINWRPFWFIFVVMLVVGGLEETWRAYAVPLPQRLVLLFLSVVLAGLVADVRDNKTNK